MTVGIRGGLSIDQLPGEEVAGQRVELAGGGAEQCPAGPGALE
jgi:hypothetical protein